MNSKARKCEFLKALSHGLEAAIEKLDDDTKQWVSAVPGDPVWANMAVKAIQTIEAEMAVFLDKQKKEYIKRLKKLKLPVAKADSVTDAMVEAFQKMVEEKILADDKEYIESLQTQAETWEKPIIDAVAQKVCTELVKNKKIKTLTKQVVEWLQGHTIKFAQQVQQTTHDAVINAMVKAYKKGNGIDAMANLMDGLPEFSRYRAKMVARTETIAAANAATLEGYRQSEVVIGKEWAASRDERTRPSHLKADGQKKKLDEPFIVGESKLMHPGDSSLGAVAEELIHCRCTTYPVLDGESLDEEEF